MISKLVPRLLHFVGKTASFPALVRSTTGIHVMLGDESGFTFTQDLYNRIGTGSPEAAVTAPIGAIYHQTDGTTGTSLWRKESGTGNTGWVAVAMIDTYRKIGTGSPEAAVTAPVGSIYQQTDGTTGTALWRKETGAGNTGWVPIAMTDTYRKIGTGSPEAAVTAPIGAIYHQTDGTTDTALWRKESGAGNTGWVPVATYVAP